MPYRGLPGFTMRSAVMHTRMPDDIDRDAVESALSKYSHQDTISLWEMANLFEAAKAWLHETGDTTAGLGWRMQ